MPAGAHLSRAYIGSASVYLSYQAVSSGFKREADTNQESRFPIAHSLDPRAVSWILPYIYNTGARGVLSLIVAAPADGAGLERRHPQITSINTIISIKLVGPIIPIGPTITWAHDYTRIGSVIGT